MFKSKKNVNKENETNTDNNKNNNDKDNDVIEVEATVSEEPSAEENITDEAKAKPSAPTTDFIDEDIPF